MAVEEKVIYKFVIENMDFQKKLPKMQTDVEKLGGNLVTASKHIGNFGSGLKTVGDKLKPVSVVIAGLGTAVIKTGIDFQSALTGVIKTTDLTGKELEDFTQGVRDMSKAIPVGTTELFALAEIAGQLGIRGSEDLLLFTETMAMLGVATDMTGEEASVTFGQIQAITKLKVGELPHMASAIVAVGNNSKTTESMVANMLLRIASGGKQIGISEQQMIGWATAIASTGMSSELGGSAFKKFANTVEKAVVEGGDKLEGFAQVAGMTSEEFKTAFETNASGALESFIQGLEGVKESGGSVTATLGDLQLSELGVSTMLNNLSGNTQDLTKYIGLSTDAWNESADSIDGNNALMREAETRYQTLESKITILWNNVKDVMQTVFTAIEPLLTEFVDKAIDKVGEFADKVGELSPDKIIAVVKGFAGLASVPFILSGVGGALTGLSSVMGFVGSTMDGSNGILTAFGKFKTIASPFMASANNVAGGFLSMLNPITFVKTAFSGLQTFFTSFPSVISGAFTSVMGFVSTLGTSLVTFGTSILSTFTMAGGGISGVLAVLSGGFTAIMGGISSLIGGFVSLVTPVGVVIGIMVLLYTQFESVRELIAVLWEAVVSAFTDIGATIVGIWEGNIKPALDQLMQAWNNLMTTIQPVVDYIANALGAVLPVIIDGFKTAFQIALQIVGQIFSTTFNIITSIINTVAGVFSGFGQIVSSIFAGDIPGILNGFKTVFTSIFDGIGTVFTDVFNGFVGIAKGVIDQIAGFFTGLKDKVGGILDKLNPFKYSLAVDHILNGGTPFGSGSQYQTNNFNYNVNTNGTPTKSSLSKLKQVGKADAYL